MRDLYIGNIVDITDPYCEFIIDFNKEIYNYGALVYNYETNSYQFIREFDHIDYKKELLPDFIKVEKANELLNAMQITIHYEFNPDEETDEENLDIWNNELSKIELPYYGYDDDGEMFIETSKKITVKPSVHTVWFLKKEVIDYLFDLDLLMFVPTIKNINIARKLIKEYCVNPFQFEADKNVADNSVWPVLESIYEARDSMEASYGEMLDDIDD